MNPPAYPPSPTGSPKAGPTRAGCPNFIAGFLVTLVLLFAGIHGGHAKSTDADKDAEKPPELSERNKKLARGTLAAVEIKGSNTVTVRETVESVFTQAGFTKLDRNDVRQIFERPATSRQTKAYGSWFGGRVTVRIEVETQSQGNGVHFVRCWSFVVRESGSLSEDKQPLARRHVREYEGLLTEVASRLN